MQAVLRGDEERNPARLADRHRRLYVPLKEEPLDRDTFRPMLLDQTGERPVDLAQPLGIGLGRHGAHAAGVDQAELPVFERDHAKATRRSPWIDAEGDHRSSW